MLCKYYNNKTIFRQTLESNQRRKDIYAALTSSMAEIFAFFLRLIELHVQQFREFTVQRNFQLASEHERVVQVKYQFDIEM